MTRDEAVARIQRGLGFRGDLTTEIIAALQEARRVLENGRSLPSFLLSEAQSLVVPLGSAGVPLPAGFIQEFQEESLWYVRASNPDNVFFLEKLDYRVALARFANVDAGPPAAYTLRTASLAVFPARDIAYTLTWSFYHHSVSLATNVSDNEWLDEDTAVPEALIGRAGMIVAADLGDTPSLQKFGSMYNVAWSAITSADQLADEENRPLAVGARL